MTQFASVRNPKQATRVTIRAVVLLSGVLTIVFLVSFVFSEEGIAELRQAQQRVDTLQTEIRQLEEENARLQAEIENLRESNFAVERIAREDLGMSKPGEMVYRIEEPATKDATAPQSEQ
ncbi:MAG TPA: septum formation initiator family protein [Thermoanaerobaculia bacterium]